MLDRSSVPGGEGGGNDRKKSFVIDPNTIIYICFTTVVVTL